MSIILTLIIIAVLVLVHEWGHYIVARKIGIPVHEFSLGFGYRLYSFKKDGVVFSIRAVPLGGFVRLAGEEVADMEAPGGYFNRKPVEKIAVSIAGPLMNFVIAIVIFILTLALIGSTEGSSEPVIGKVEAGFPAAQAGLQQGDRIISIEGNEIKQWDDVVENTRNSGKSVLNIQYDHRGEIYSVPVNTVVLDSAGSTGIGIYPIFIQHRYSLTQSVAMGFQQTYELTKALVYSLVVIVTGGATMNDVAGPVGIVRMVGDFAQLGFVTLLTFTAFLSINLGFMNLLPIPALDGGRIIFALFEMVTRKPFPREKEGFLHWIGFMVLMLLMVLVTFNDIVRCFKG
ncbi:MAG: RIP metalloprotease RseP [Syntrophomonadaceae bacterium]|jgi:regulator of sigma E protease|nr:RIP metalloprotease RseP [Syntrophomonadaceae bacterium]